MKTIPFPRVQAVSDALLLVNAAHPLPPSAAPDLVCADPRWPEVKLERRAAGLLQACIQAADGQDSIVPVSGWRSREEQQSIWDDTMAKEGEAFTRQYVALPGCSEHQTGLAIDLGQAAKEIDFIRPDFPYDGVCGAFRRLAAAYGFILRYPAGKESVTGIAHEPWHFRYVGIPHARLMEQNNLVLEEYPAFLGSECARRPLHLRAGSYDFEIWYCPEDGPLPPPPEGARYRQVSRDNCGGTIITTWR